jgi:hypothetical protein
VKFAAIARLFLEIVSRVAGYLRDKQLLDAGRAIERDRLSTEERERRDDANRARLSAGDDSVFVDPFDAANRRGVPDVPADRLRQPSDTG